QRDDGLVDACRNLVPVPGDAVASVPVVVEAGGVELDAVALGEGSAHLLEDGRLKWTLRAGAPARGEPGLDPVLLVEEPRSLRPGEGRGQRPEERVRAGHPAGHNVHPGGLIEMDPLQPGEGPVEGERVEVEEAGLHRGEAGENGRSE